MSFKLIFIDILGTNDLITSFGYKYFQRSINAISISPDNKLLMGIGTDDHHMLAIFDINTQVKLFDVGCAHGLPGQMRGILWCPGLQHTEYITKGMNTIIHIFFLLFGIYSISCNYISK